MRLEKIHFQNFRCFEDREFTFSPQFNLVVGENGSGKSALLRGVALALEMVPAAFEKKAMLSHGSEDRRLVPYESKGGVDIQTSEQSSIRSIVELKVDGGHAESLKLGRLIGEPALPRPGAFHDVDEVKLLSLAGAVRQGKGVTLPVVASYGVGRQQASTEAAVNIRLDAPEQRQRQKAYESCFAPTIDVQKLLEAIVLGAWAELVEPDSEPRSIVVRAARQCIPGAEDIFFHPRRKEVMVTFSHRSTPVPFNALSDGQRNILALVGDIAVRAATLNPHLEDRVLEETPGIVLIDELDLHLHPKWQRRIIDDLKRIFPKIQFISTTHSPFLIQALEPGELINLDDPENLHEYADESIEDIAEDVMDVDLPQRSRRYKEMMEAAEEYYRFLDEAAEDPRRLQEAEASLQELRIPYGNDPGYMAVLKLETEKRLRAKENGGSGASG